MPVGNLLMYALDRRKELIACCSMLFAPDRKARQNMIQCKQAGSLYMRSTKMNRLSLLPPRLTGSEPAAGPSPTTETRLPKRWLAAARVVWILVAVLTGVHFIASIPPTFVGLQRICA